MTQVFRSKQVSNTIISKVISWQLQILHVLQEVNSSQMVQVAMIQFGQVLCLESPNVLSHGEATHLLYDSVFQIVVKQEVQIDREDSNIRVVLKDVLEKVILELIEEVERLLGDTNFLCALKELDRLEVDFFQLYDARLEDSLAEHQGLFVDAPQIQHDFLGREVG